MFGRLTCAAQYGLWQNDHHSCESLSRLYPPSSILSPPLWWGSPLQPALRLFCSPLPVCSPFTHSSYHTFSSPQLWALFSLASVLLIPLWVPTCCTRCFFLRPSTPLPVTQYFQFTLLLSNLPLHSFCAPLHYLPLSSSAFCPPLAVGLSGWKDGFKVRLSPLPPPLNSSYTHTPNAHTVECAWGSVCSSWHIECAQGCVCSSWHIDVFVHGRPFLSAYQCVNNFRNETIMWYVYALT